LLTQGECVKTKSVMRCSSLMLVKPVIGNNEWVLLTGCAIAFLKQFNIFNPVGSISVGCSMLKCWLQSFFLKNFCIFNALSFGISFVKFSRLPNREIESVASYFLSHSNVAESSLYWFCSFPMRIAQLW
jgi:hypothetical protein